MHIILLLQYLVVQVLRSVGLYAAVMAVSTIPGEMLVTLTPVFANSFSNP